MPAKATVLKNLSMPKNMLPVPNPAQGCRYSSNDLFKGQTEIQIEHQGAEYRLRITRSGGLILNK